TWPARRIKKAPVSLAADGGIITRGWAPGAPATAESSIDGGSTPTVFQVLTINIRASSKPGNGGEKSADSSTDTDTRTIEAQQGPRARRIAPFWQGRPPPRGISPWLIGLERTALPRHASEVDFAPHPHLGGVAVGKIAAIVGAELQSRGVPGAEYLDRLEIPLAAKVARSLVRFIVVVHREQVDGIGQHV